MTLKLKTKVFILLFSGSIAIGSANVSQEIENITSKEVCYMRINRAMRDDEINHEEIDASLYREECTEISALLMEINVDSDIQLFRINNEKQLLSTVDAYDRINKLYENIGLYVRYHNSGKYLLVAGGNFEEEEFSRYSKKLDEAIELTKDMFEEEK